ncbi:quinolinate synthase NadA [Candidatus Albibeggiatoa sp. nov. BB20]|uniref:quinolinate synthase NadA n=1 Tax=Candidatus Albibeggiatoa sp. nov. BB20 TaxID=3162723 RepID=UPI0033659914
MGVAEIAINEYTSLTDKECHQRIEASKQRLGNRLVILGHHYQRQSVFEHADYSGDSLKLSRQAAQSSAEYIVFCGVHFMAEVADIMSRPEQVSILPDLGAGCSMADMANLAAVEKAWQELSQIIDAENTITPMTYINSAADLKAFCGRHQGIVCTSSNAPKILDWAFAQREKILFFPDQHLGRNTGYEMGIPLDEMVVWDFTQPRGGLTIEQIKKAKMILWKGYCSVHQVFKPEHIDAYRAKYPEGKVISHPESSFEVCQKSDDVGSTEYILNTIRQSPEGMRWLVGTELNMVIRIAEEMKPKGVNVHFMSPTLSMCSTMYRTDPQHLLWTLENIEQGCIVNQIKVDPSEAEQARLALQRMFDAS